MLLLTLDELNPSLCLWDTPLGILGLNCLLCPPCSDNLVNSPASTKTIFYIPTVAPRSFRFPSMSHTVHGELPGSGGYCIGPTISGTFFTLSYSSVPGASHLLAIQQILIEYLLGLRHSSRCWGYHSEHRVLTLMGLILNPHINHVVYSVMMVMKLLRTSVFSGCTWIGPPSALCVSTSCPTPLLSFPSVERVWG